MSEDLEKLREALAEDASISDRLRAAVLINTLATKVYGHYATPLEAALLGHRSRDAELAEKDAEIARLKQWKPIEAAPKNGDRILGGWMTEWGFRTAEVFWEMEDGEGGYWTNGYFDGHHSTAEIEPTHWMPIPRPPALLAKHGKGEE